MQGYGEGRSLRRVGGVVVSGETDEGAAAEKAVFSGNYPRRRNHNRTEKL